MNYIIQGETLTDIANAIREKTGKSEPILAENMASEILSISGAVVEEGGIDENTLLMIHGDSLVDSSFNKLQLTVSGAEITDEQTKLKKPVIKFDGLSYISVQNPMFVLGGDYTIDWWEYRKNNGTMVAINAFPGGLAGLVYLGGSTFYGSINGVGWDALSSFAVPGTKNFWTHYAIVKSGNELSVYFNGNKQASTTLSGDMISGDGLVYIGSRDYNLGDFFQGYMSEFRISNIARWTTDFEPPTTPYTQTGGALNG